jgi:hypothetical protein
MPDLRHVPTFASFARDKERLGRFSYRRQAIPLQNQASSITGASTAGLICRAVGVDDFVCD